ncbi:DUF3866 domain-containing protein [Nocardiopsis gilva YIM 90087]|uniref:DUF3866 domain-containing protein n=1 Tax=Nocardiopsis gilva YIM 90087 TaxID=1235441 RepID=A0A223S6F4_9ACTN|nr:DUF3866 family protein [Nocardiopsis gilva]ASU83706.1 DUF3866 domain-containing protein [Nocardiopsis gilva YIM 90087]
MIRWRSGQVTAIRRTWPGAAELDVRVAEGGPASDDTSADASGGATRPAQGNAENGDRTCRALAYTDLVGHPEEGDRVLLNTTALDMGLGTGGYALVVALPDRLPPDPDPAPGHLVKARYTPLQTTVLGADEQDSPHHALLRDADGVDGMPVVTADLHSALPAIVAGIRDSRPEARVVYVMLDGGALPAAFSRSVVALREAGLLAATVTVGQAFGGDLETVSVHTGLLAARHILGADAAIVTQGPGNLGTGTRWGFSGVSTGEAVNATAVLGGHAVAALRVSEADPRERHRGVSHHSLTAYGKVALAPADIVVPQLPGAFGTRVRSDAAPLAERHLVVEVPIDGLRQALKDLPLRLSTMGRTLDADAAYFLTAAAAGRHAASLIASS